MTSSSITYLATLLRTDSGDNEAPRHASEPGDFLAAARNHGILPLLHEAAVMGKLSQFSEPVRTALRVEARQQGVLGLLREGALRTALAALADAGVQVLLMKGTALAYGYYAAPHLRPRCDTDLLVHEDQRTAAAKVLCALGYVPQNAVEGELISYQRSYRNNNFGAVPDTIDLHWRLTNPHRFANLIRHQDLRQESVPVPQLGPAARAIGPRHALWLACVHRIAHHTGDERLIWLYDLHLLVTAMSESEIVSFAELAIATGVAGSCADGLATASLLLATPLPSSLLGRLKQAGETEPRFLPPSPRRWHALWSDLAALPDWQHRLRLLTEHIFPPADYMLRKYGNPPRIVLPVLYLRRALRAGRKLARAQAPERPPAQASP